MNRSWCQQIIQTHRWSRKTSIYYEWLRHSIYKILSIKSQCDEVASHISNIEVSLYDLLKGKLSPNLVNTDSLAQTLNTLRDKLIKKGYTLGLNEITDIILKGELLQYFYTFQSTNPRQSYQPTNILISQ